MVIERYAVRKAVCSQKESEQCPVCLCSTCAAERCRLTGSCEDYEAPCTKPTDPVTVTTCAGYASGRLPPCEYLRCDGPCGMFPDGCI